MRYYVSETKFEAQSKNAGNKARNDVESILKEKGFEEIAIQLEENKGGALNSIDRKLKVAKRWKKSLANVNTGDTIVIQVPLTDSLFVSKHVKKLQKKGVNIIILIHDLDMLRFTADSYKRRAKIKIEELSLLSCADLIIAHNDRMKEKLERMGIKGNIKSLEIFDYLIPDFDEDRMKERKITRDGAVIVAGNLMRSKSAYLYNLPDYPFNFYGVGYDGEAKNVDYKGSFLPDELPYVLEGSFGLIWDGDTPDTCGGPFGKYLTINNPHKTSLYLASGIPVIIWDKAALASFVKQNKCGITVSSLKDIKTAIASISDEQYEEFKANAEKISCKLREGYYLSKAVL